MCNEKVYVNLYFYKANAVVLSLSLFSQDFSQFQVIQNFRTTFDPGFYLNIGANKVQVFYNNMYETIFMQTGKTYDISKLNKIVHVSFNTYRKLLGEL